MDGFISISADTRISFSPWCPRVLSLVLDRFYVGISTKTTFPLLISSVVGDVNTAITTPRSIYIRHRPSLVYGCIDGASSVAALCDCGDGTTGPSYTPSMALRAKEGMLLQRTTERFPGADAWRTVSYNNGEVPAAAASYLMDDKVSYGIDSVVLAHKFFQADVRMEEDDIE